ncbi:hypothetical protein L0Y40_01720 [Candidatus Wolfebacteria bacterium]|nr:hypothetical protein [Candidatus Wolfebacteria bacterium]
MKGGTTRDVTFSWEEGRYFDLWMIAHIVGGALIGFLTLYYVPLGRVWAYVLGIVLIAGWELIEAWFNIEETTENRLLDIVAGVAGFILAYELGLRLVPQAQFALMVYSAIMAAALDLLGWLDYRRRAAENSGE